jgi:uncharacterized RDD family membrane protein YckC
MTMRIARVRDVLRREKTRVVVAVLAPALLILAMGPLALLRPAVPMAPVPVTPSATVSRPATPTTTLRPRSATPGIHGTRVPRRNGDDKR